MTSSVSWSLIKCLLLLLIIYLFIYLFGIIILITAAMVKALEQLRLDRRIRNGHHEPHHGNCAF